VIAPSVAVSLEVVLRRHLGSYQQRLAPGAPPDTSVHQGLPIKDEDALGYGPVDRLCVSSAAG
jgi:hypothetical protein